MMTNTNAIKHVAFVKMSILRVSLMIDMCYWLTLEKLESTDNLLSFLITIVQRCQVIGPRLIQCIALDIMMKYI